MRAFGHEFSTMRQGESPAQVLRRLRRERQDWGVEMAVWLVLMGVCWAVGRHLPVPGLVAALFEVAGWICAVVALGAAAMWFYGGAVIRRWER